MLDGVDLKSFITSALTEGCFGTEEVNRDEFIEHMRTLRGRVTSGRVEVLEVIREGNRIADRHRVELIKTDGSAAELEVFLFGELDETGRLVRVDEFSRLISGEPSDEGLARER